MWDEFIQEEIRVGPQQSDTCKSRDENLALVGKGKSKPKKGSNSSGMTSKGKKDVEFIKVKSFSCHKIGHFASQCLKKKKRGPSHKWRPH